MFINNLAIVSLDQLDSNSEKSVAEIQKLREETRKLAAEARKAELEARDLETPYWRRTVFVSTVFQGAALVLTLAAALFSWTVNKAVREAESAKEELEKSKKVLADLQKEIVKDQKALDDLRNALKTEEANLHSAKIELATAGIRALLKGSLTVDDAELLREQLSIKEPAIRALRYREAETKALDPKSDPFVRMILLDSLYLVDKDPRYKDWMLKVLLDAPANRLDEATRTMAREFNIPQRLEQRTLWKRFTLHPESQVIIGGIFLNHFRYDPLFRKPFIVALDAYDGASVGIPNFGLRRNQIVFFKRFRSGKILDSGLPQLPPHDLSLDLSQVQSWSKNNAELINKLTEPGLPVLDQCSDDVFLNIIQGQWVTLEELTRKEGNHNIR